MTISRKIGLHIINGTSLQLGQPTVTKLVDPSLEYYRQVRAEVGVECLIVVRFTHAIQDVSVPAQNALGWWNAHSGWILSVPAAENVVYEGWNEIGDSKADQFCSFEVSRLQIMHANNRRAAVGCFSVGTPDLNVWPRYAAMLAAMNSNDVLALHEYWSDHADLENIWHVRRFTIPSVAASIGSRKIVITECGRDVVEGHGDAGWQQSCSVAGYMEDLRRLSELYDACPNVIGATVYQVGSWDSTWAPFDATPVWPTVVAEYAAEVVSPIPPTDTAPETPIVLAPPIREIDIVRITQTFDPPNHYGVDYSCYEGTPLFAAVDGIAYRGDQGSAGFGRYVRVEDGNGLYVYTAHMRDWHVGEGALVQAGDLLGYSGNTGNSTGPHLHFEVRKGSRQQACAIDPGPLIVWDEPANVEPLPNDEQGDAHTLAQKARWWTEQWKRESDAGNTARAEAIRLSLIDLLYRLENMLA